MKKTIKYGSLLLLSMARFCYQVWLAKGTLVYLCIAELLLLYRLYSMESEVEKMKKRLFGQITYIDEAYEGLDI